MPRRELMTIASIQKHRQKASILAADIKAKAETQNKYIFICAASSVNLSLCLIILGSFYIWISVVGPSASRCPQTKIRE